MGNRADADGRGCQRVGGSDAAGIYDQMEDQKAAGIPPSWTTFISVDDVDATTAKVVPDGGSVVAENLT
jgi:predicted enzyme related to lactoylglutathione lyase